MDIQLRIQIVLLMAKFESPITVLRQLKHGGHKDIPTTQYIGKLYAKFCQFGTVLDLEKSGKPKICDENSTNPIREILENNPKTTISSICGQTNLSRGTVHNRIKDNIGVKSYKIQIHQELYEDDIDIRVKMAENLTPILQNPANKNLIFFLMKLHFTYRVVYINITVVFGVTKNQLRFKQNHYIVQKFMFGVLCHRIA